MAYQSDFTRAQADGGAPAAAIPDDQMRYLRYVRNANQRASAGWTGILLEKLRRAACSQRLRAVKQFHATFHVFCIISPTLSVY
jgi:hypothetical protein